MKEKTLKRLAASAAALVAFCTLAAPTAAFAVPLNITMTEENGGEPPAATITIAKSADNTVIKEIQFAGGSATVETVDVTENEAITISAASSDSHYVYGTQQGTPNASGATVTLKAKRVVNVNVQLKASGVTDYSGVTVKMYTGTDTSGDPKVSVPTDSSGLVTISSVSAGTYTLVLELPASLQGKIPQSQQVTVPSNPTEDVSVTIGTDTSESESSSAESSSDSAESTASASAETATTSASGISQTGDSSTTIVIGICIAAIAIAIVVVIIRHIRG